MPGHALRSCLLGMCLGMDLGFSPWAPIPNFGHDDTRRMFLSSERSAELSYNMLYCDITSYAYHQAAKSWRLHHAAFVILDLLQLEVGATLGLAVDGERLIVDPKVKPRYTLRSCWTPLTIPSLSRLKSGSGLMRYPWAASCCESWRYYMVSLDPTHGHERRGRRPVLVISPTAFNQATKLPVILPITSGGNLLAGSASPFRLLV